jgi:hypothetical protein
MTKELLSMISAIIAVQLGKPTEPHSNFAVSPIAVLRQMGHKEAWGFKDDFECPRFHVWLNNSGATHYIFSMRGRLVGYEKSNKAVTLCEKCSPNGVQFPGCKSCVVR